MNFIYFAEVMLLLNNYVGSVVDIHGFLPMVVYPFISP